MLAFTLVTQAQSAKKFNKSGEKQLKSNQLNEAKASFTAAINLDPNLVEAYVNRANVYMKMGENDLAIEDFDMVNKLDPKDGTSWLRNGNLNFDKKEYKKAGDKFAGYLNIEPKELVIYDRIISCFKNIEDYQKALFYAKKKLEVKETPETHFEIASLYYILQNYKSAEVSYREAIKESPANIDYHNGLALALYFQDRYDAAIGETNIVLRADKNNKQAFLTRARSYHKKIDYTYAINDMSKVIVLYQNDDDYLDNLNFRGDLYLEFSQHMNAISDYSKVIGKDDQNTYALYKRGLAYEEITRNDDAKADFAKIITIAGSGAVVDADLLSNSKTKLYELKREGDAPLISLKNENVTDNHLRVTFDSNEIELFISVKDANEIKGVFVDGESVKVNANQGQVEVSKSISLIDVEKIEVKAEDTYGNIATLVVEVERVENDPPLVNFMLPFTNENKEMLLDTDDSRVYFEGNIQDESLIKSIMIDDVIIPFNREEQNPVFSTNMDLRDKTKLAVVVTDVYDNTYKQEYFLNRESALYAADSPMGKTWVIFVENSEYETFASLDGPVKDVRLMRSALANYEIHNFIHRSNLTKQQMARFFSIELRDMVKKNNVNSLIIWYAGHGKFQNETGYWIPVDADRNDEFSFFNINNLKASMQVYANELTHTLIITDACESGPSFYQAMRNDIEVRSCSDDRAVKFKSSQVLSSAGYELASDNSQFTRTFANSLINNEEPCLPIESIVLNVGEAVKKDNQQKPQFGKIAGLEDENGTFFFIKRESQIPNQDTTEGTDNGNAE
jgi:tetratricopeptide (TPR) repeat protein